jgi:hypothetical protein
MLYLSKTIFAYRSYKILVIDPTTEVKAESIGAPSVKEINVVYPGLCVYAYPTSGYPGFCVYPDPTSGIFRVLCLP